MRRTFLKEWTNGIRLLPAICRPVLALVRLMLYFYLTTNRPALLATVGAGTADIWRTFTR